MGSVVDSGVEGCVSPKKMRNCPLSPALVSIFAKAHFEAHVNILASLVCLRQLTSASFLIAC